MKSFNDPVTFISRRSHRHNNHRYLPLNRISIAPIAPPGKQLSDRIGTQPNHKSSRFSYNKSGREPIEKMNRFKNMVSSFDKIKDDMYGNGKDSECGRETSQREILNRSSIAYNQSEGFKSYRSKTLSRQINRQHRAIKSVRNREQDQYSTLDQFRRIQTEIPKRPTTKSGSTTRQRLNLSSTYSCKQASNQTQNQSLSQILTLNPQHLQIKETTDKLGQFLSNNQNEALNDLLAEYGIVSAKQLDDFLMENRFLQNLYQHTSRNISMKTPFSKYQKTYKTQVPIDEIALEASNYECLSDLHLKKNDIKNYKTVAQQDYKEKTVLRNQTELMERQSQQKPTFEQISYKTSYQFDFNNPKLKIKQQQAHKPSQQTLIQGLKFIGTTQYQKDSTWMAKPETQTKTQTQRYKSQRKHSNRRPERKEKELEERKLVHKIIMSDQMENKKNNGSSHNAIATKGFSVFTTTYTDNFAPKPPSCEVTDYKSQPTTKHQPEQDDKVNCKVSSFMYQTTNKRYCTIEQSQNPQAKRKKVIVPWKYNLLSQLKSLIELDNQNKKATPSTK